jgi:hypothetical protein
MAHAAFPRTWQALADATALVQAHWIDLATQTLDAGELGPYVRGLQHATSVQLHNDGSSLSGDVRNVAPMARWVETGHGAFHLPSRIDWGTARAHRSKQGRLYLVIPFRHYSAQRGMRAQASSPRAQRAAMPRAVYNVAQRLRPGESLHMPHLPPYAPRTMANWRPGYTHASPYERMQRTGHGRGVRYLTFRTLAQGSPGWWIPARPGRYLAEQTRRDTAAPVQAMLAQAFRLDMAALMAEHLKGGGT